ncbi:Rieske 2Fe-2S domain-containing protein [Lacibacter sediminis]|uniref:Ferric reductase-like transmembrane domain-containing protein n=1 Tax=Lacibacter sediminis TaxID=2760713 RepID=A0A7G5XDD7_9BACT|nr:Rieske 2Fe-2S domain-containing protein [Lacibacter sediminis]QNA43490.1 ferric reductase-like transmembrane domain-containing protein [Lacibacter sediminis]
MSTAYSAVGWNRQKKIYDGWIAAFCITYLALFISLTLLFNSEATFETILIRSTSTLAVLLLHIILSIGPLTRLNKKFMPLLYNRRHLGVTMFSFAAVHGIFSIIQFHSLSNTNPFLSLFLSNTNYGSVPAFPFQTLGFIALIIFFLMAITSHDFWLHNLSPIVWKTLHMFVYAAYILVVMHVMLGVIQYEKNPAFVLILFTGSASLIILHLLAGQKERKIDKMKFKLKEDGFVYVCEADEIEDSRAKIFCIDQERIAVYRHENKLYAIHNVCKHQGGPLGEGKIVDGCITCPWHGYQYLPQNGQSPPPFKEKVSTYDVLVNNNKVWLNPTAYAEGTERKGASL